MLQISNARSALELFGKKWNGKYPLIAKSWQANWQRINPMFALPKANRLPICPRDF